MTRVQIPAAECILTIAARYWLDMCEHNERHTHTHARTHTHAHTHTRTSKQTSKQTNSPCVPPGKLSWFDINFATHARTHVQRIQARLHKQQDCNSAATCRKEAMSTDAPEAYVYDIMGARWIYNIDLKGHCSCRARYDDNITARNKKHRRQESNRGLPVLHPRL